MIRKFLPGLLLLVLVFSSAIAQEKAYDAERFDVDVWVQPDGSLLVQEAVTFNFQGGPFSYVFRELPTNRTDGIVDLTAGVDSEIWPEGTGPNQIEISGRNPIEVVWHLSPTSNTSRTFGLTYRPLGVVQREDAAETLVWQALPDDYDYAIRNSRVTFHYPPGAVLTGTPWVTAGTATVEAGNNQVVFNLTDLAPGDPLVVRLDFPPGTFSGNPPAWQTRASTHSSRAWIWISAAAVVLAGGLLAIIATTRNRYPRPVKSTALADRPPIDLPPALAGYLFNSQISWQHGLATMFDLAGRGLIEIEQVGEKKWHRPDEFFITLLKRPDDLRPHENALLTILFTDKAGVEQETITVSEMGKLITSSRWKGYSESLKDEANLEGFVDLDARHRGRQLSIWGIVSMLLTLPLMVLVFLFEPFFGFWSLILVGALFLVGVIATIAGAAIPTLSQRGVQLASAFDPFRRHLQAVSKGKADLSDPGYYETYLPYTAAFGFAEAWVKQQGKSGYEQVPAYFRSMSEISGGEMVIFIAAISAASNAGGAAGASSVTAAGAGAAGGGASGAG
jgi:hypothetical protein